MKICTFSEINASFFEAEYSNGINATKEVSVHGLEIINNQLFFRGYDDNGNFHKMNPLHLFSKETGKQIINTFV
jgi:hypothetical protein